MRLSDIYPVIKSTLTEVSMAPSSLQQWAKSPIATGMLMGFEAEMCVPDTESEGGGGVERDYDTDERANSIDDIIEFFGTSNGDYGIEMSRRQLADIRDTMNMQYDEWLNDNEHDYHNDNKDTFNDYIRTYLHENFDYDEMEDEAQEKLGDDLFPETHNIDDVKRELGHAQIEKIIEKEAGPLWDRAHDHAAEQIRDDMRNDGDFDEESWLRDRGIESMSDAENDWNFVWPHYISTGGGTTSVESVAEELRYALGNVSMVTGDSYHGATRNGTDWIIEPDSTIEVEDYNDAGLEIISPPLPLSDALMYLQKTKEWAGGYGCYTNDSTGLHINISVPNFSVEKLDYVKLAIFMGDKHILDEFGRRSNSYCESAIDIVKRRANEADTALQVMAKMREQLNTEASKMIHGGMTQKYTSINVRKGWVEFRGPGGDYLDKPIDTLVNTTLRLAMALSIACDETLYKQEYAKKLYKMIAPEAGFASSENAIGLFARYMSASISKTELKDNLRQINQVRVDKKLLDVALRKFVAPVAVPTIPVAGEPAQSPRPLQSADDQNTELPQWNVVHRPTGRQVIVHSANPQYAIQQVAQNHNFNSNDLTAAPI